MKYIDANPDAVPVCKTCGQRDFGQTGEYHCPECGVARVWDKIPEKMTAEQYAMLQQIDPIDEEKLEDDED